MKAVVIGGGTGAPVSIKVLRSLGIETSAVIAMADDGGSSGKLRKRTGKVPPGDIRKCLIAMARDPQDPWARAFAERFDYAGDHALGNLILLALEETTHSFTEAIRLCERLLDAQGHVYPSTLESVVLTGITRDGRRLNGQSTICKSQTALAHVSLTPASAQPNQEAIDALLEADLITLGPGSLFTSVIPNLLVPGVLDAIRTSRACKVFICSLGDMQGETWGLTAFEHVEALFDHGLRGALDVVIVHCDTTYEQAREPGVVTGVFQAVCEQTATPANLEAISEPIRTPVESYPTQSYPTQSYPTQSYPARSYPARSYPIRSVVFTNEDAERIQEAGVLLVARDLRDLMRPTWHDCGKLADALRGVIQACHVRGA